MCANRIHLTHISLQLTIWLQAIAQIITHRRLRCIQLKIYWDIYIYNIRINVMFVFVWIHIKSRSACGGSCSSTPQHALALTLKLGMNIESRPTNSASTATTKTRETGAAKSNNMRRISSGRNSTNANSTHKHHWNTIRSTQLSAKKIHFSMKRYSSVKLISLSL